MKTLIRDTVYEWLKVHFSNTYNKLALKIMLNYLHPMIFGIVLIFSSCKKFVDIPPPETKLVTASVFNNNATAHQAMTTIYSQMMEGSESWNIAQGLGLSADELKSYSTNINQVQLYTNSVVPTGSYGLWLSYYKYIYEANAVIEGVQNNAGLSTSVKQQLVGEAKFVRAFFHICLTNIYGDVPLVLTTDYTMNRSISRTPRIQVLQQVVADLKTAQDMLNSNYVGANDTTAMTERIRPNKAAAAALLARAYLYLGDYSKDAANYANAEAQASLVINNSLYSLVSLGGVFLKNSNEAIWQLQTPLPANSDTQDGSFFILISAPSTLNNNSTTISSQLMSSFEPGDQRQTSWIGSYSTTTPPNVTYYFPYKYKNRTLLNQEYTMVLRLGEQYLIRAEARAQQGNALGALADLNTVRNRAGLANYAGATDKVSLLAAILHERQVELFTEWGNRWFDLIRTGNANAVMSVVTPLKGGTWGSDGHQLLFPIPQTDRNNDPNLTQNQGY